MNEPAAHDIFVSYSRRDKRWVRHFVERLVAARGWSIWWDQGLRTGESFDRRIDTQIRAASCVLVVWSAHSVESEWVRAEASEGWDRGVLMPVLIDDCLPPMPFRQTHATDLAAWSGRRDETAFKQLLDDIGRVVDAGGSAAPAIRTERVLRRKRIARRRMIRRASYAFALVLVLGAGWGAYRAKQSHSQRAAFSEQLAARSLELRASVLQRSHEERDSYWPYVMAQRGRTDRLQLAGLLASEAYRIEPTPEAERALRDALALLVAPVMTLPSEERIVSLTFSPNGRLLAGTIAPDGLVVWNLDSRQVALKRHSNAAYAFNPVTGNLAIAAQDTGLSLLNESATKTIRPIEVDGTVTALSFSADGGRMIAGGSDGQVWVLDADSGQPLAQLDHSERIGTVALSRTGAFGAWVDRSRFGLIFHATSGATVARLSIREMTRVTFSPDESLAVTNGRVSLYDLATGELRYELMSPTSEPTQYFPVFGEAVFTPDSSYLLVRSREGLIWWDVRERRILLRRWHTSALTDLALSQDARIAVTSSRDMTARVWLSEDGSEIARFAHRWAGRGVRMEAVAISPDGSLVATATPGRSVDLWESWPAKPLDAACQRLRRNLTPFEWQQYLGDRPYRATCRNLD